MRISCIIPTKDRCSLVMRAIDSAVNQANASLEVVIVDDGSTDDTVAQVNRRFPAVRVVRLPGLGPGRARNAGADACSGDILMFLDSDDYWYPRHVEKLTERITSGYQVAYGVTRTEDEISGGEFLIPADGKGRSGDCFAALTSWCFLVPSAVALTRTAYAAVGGFGPEPFGEDWCLFLRLAARFPFGFSGGEPITMRKLHKGSLCNLTNADKLLTLVQQLSAILESEKRSSPDMLDRFAGMKQLIERRGREFRTVQDWYLALQKEGLLCHN